MKKLLLATMATILLSAATVFADTVITAPIDSRPVSTDYLQDLAELGGDKFICVDDENLDYFSAVDEDNHFGNSQAVREELTQIVSEHNTSTARVIINSSSYITNGLVGSRCGVNYSDYEQAIEDLRDMLTQYENPTYYFNLSMPRTLPETRLNTVWKDDTADKGIGYYYLQYNPDAEDAQTIKDNYYYVTPIQLIMEYSYVENKAAELGKTELTSWERDFLNYFTKKYVNTEPYKTYIRNYKLPYEATAAIFGDLLELQSEGLLDEIIVSNDDFQLPNSITYFASQGEDWASTVKYSFARTYMSTGRSSIYAQLSAVQGNSEKNFAMRGNGKKVNFIFGTDEVPQLIYARDLSKRKKLSANINLISNNLNMDTSTFDITRPATLINAAIDFTSYSSSKTEKQFDVFMYDYTVKTEVKDFLKKMHQSVSKDNNVGLIELFSNATLSNGGNSVFRTIKDGGTTYLTLTDLDSYSAWNTNANAIGLGIAHTQAFAIMQQISTTSQSTAQAQFNLLLQHIVEDGIYTIQTKRELYGYVPTVEEREYSQMLYDKLDFESIKEQFAGATVEINGRTYKVLNTELTECCFPWGRVFDCYLNVDTSVKEVK